MGKFESTYYLNGKFVPRSRALISVNDLGWVRGYGVFDFLVTYKGKPFLLRQHIKRLKKSARLIDLGVPWTSEKLEKLVFKTLQKNKDGKEKSVRIVVTGGVSSDSVSTSKKPTLAIFVEDRNYLSKKYYTKGASVITFDYARLTPQAKTLNYTLGIKALTMAKKSGAIEAIYINSKLNCIYEGTTSNLFIVKNGKVFTPNSDILAGITREVVFKLCQKLLPTKEKRLSLKELFKADEVFITASNKEVMPVVKVDSKVIANGKPGPITKLLMKEYQNFIEERKW